MNGSDNDGQLPRFIKNIINRISSTVNNIAKKINNAVLSFPDNISMYSEHHKKGSTNPSNRNKHEEGQARKDRDQGKEKGDSRRKDRSNKRHNSFLQGEEVLPKITGAVIAITAIGGILYFSLNDATGLGILDDAAICPTIELYRRGVAMMTG